MLLLRLRLLVFQWGTSSAFSSRPFEQTAQTSSSRIVASAFPDAGMQEDQQFYEFDEDLRVRPGLYLYQRLWVRPMIVGLYFCFVADPRLFAAGFLWDAAGHIISDFLWDAAQCAYRRILSSRRRFSPLGEILCDEMEALCDCSSGMGHFLSQT